MGRIAGNTWRSGVYSEYSSGQAKPVQTFDRSFEIGCILEFDKAESPGMPGHTITDYLGERHGVTLLFKPLP
jgi:hypothetical protein